jgi:thioredoxin-related protein
MGSFASAAELVMVEQTGCHWCERWDAEISHIYPKTEEGQRAPLRRVDLRDLPVDLTFRSPPVFTPTFVLVQDGQELARLEGYNGDEFFWFLLGQMLNDNADRIDPEVTQ